MTSIGAITSKIKHAITHKTSPARLAQLLQPSVAFCFSLQPMTAHWTVRRHRLQAKTKCRGLQQLCNSRASLAGLVLCFIACFILLVIPAYTNYHIRWRVRAEPQPLKRTPTHARRNSTRYTPQINLNYRVAQNIWHTLCNNTF